MKERVNITMMKPKKGQHNKMMKREQQNNNNQQQNKKQEQHQECNNNKTTATATITIMFLSYDRSVEKWTVWAHLQSKFKIEDYDGAICCTCSRECPGHSGLSHLRLTVWVG